MKTLAIALTVAGLGLASLPASADVFYRGGCGYNGCGYRACPTVRCYSEPRVVKYVTTVKVRNVPCCPVRRCGSGCGFFGWW